MSKEKLIYPLILLCLVLSFIIISSLVYISNGNPGLIRKKLKIGAMILSLTAIITGGCNLSHKPIQAMCYYQQVDGGDINDSEDTQTDNVNDVILYDTTIDNQNDYEVSCYKRGPQDEFLMNNLASDGTIILDLSQSNILSGKISYRNGTQYSYKIVNEFDIQIQSGNIEPADGIFDETEEDFNISVNENLLSGDYWIRLYIVSVNEQQTEPDNYWSNYKLRIVNE